MVINDACYVIINVCDEKLEASFVLLFVSCSIYLSVTFALIQLPISGRCFSLNCISFSNKKNIAYGNHSRNSKILFDVYSDCPRSASIREMMIST